MVEYMPDNIGRRIGDLSDLPDVLKKQLTSSKLDDLEEKIVTTLKNRFDGMATIDEIMVGLYRDFEHIVEDRKVLSNKLYRMTKSDILESVGKRRGIYRAK